MPTAHTYVAFLSLGIPLFAGRRPTNKTFLGDETAIMRSFIYMYVLFACLQPHMELASSRPYLKATGNAFRTTSPYVFATQCVPYLSTRFSTKHRRVVLDPV